MKTLYIMRHAKSAWDDPHLTDFDRPLAPRGRRAAPRIAEFMREHSHVPDLVLCSAACRARHTWERMAPVLGKDIPLLLEVGLYMAGAEDWLVRLRRVEENVSSVLAIGHNPGLQRLAVAMSGDGNRDLLGAMRSKYPTAALAVLEFENVCWQDLRTGGANLLRFVVPRALT